MFLEVKNIKKDFDGTKVLKGIDFSLEKGKVLSIIGSSGSGKTTLLRCITSLEKASDGEMFLDGNKIFDANDNGSVFANIRSFGLVFQQFNLFPQYTALENVALAPTLRVKELYKTKRITSSEKATMIEKVNEDALGLLKKVGLYEKRDNYPCQLSGGQQQRVAIARALALSPEILCFDEPTSALDPELTGEVLRVILDLKNSGHTMIVVTHEMEFAKNISDNVIFMSDGVIEEQGAPNELFNNPKSEKLRAFLSNSSKIIEM